MPRDVDVVVVAAGQGSRFGGSAPKQFHPIGGVPMVLRAVRPFLAHPDVSRVILVLPPADAASPPSFLAGLAGERLLLVPGGAARSDSVAAGLRVLSADCVVVVVHDGAGPFVARGIIDAVIAHARRGEPAIAAVALRDTLKEAASDDPSRVVRTLPREHLWRAQTPQAFPREILTAAHQRAAGEGRSSTDDAELVERAGIAVRLVPDSTHNLKITTPDDLVLAELLAGRGS